MNLRGARALVVGLGSTGAAVASALLQAGAHVTAVDAAAGEAVEASAQQLRVQGATVLLGRSQPLPGPWDLVVPSPGVPEHSPMLTALEGEIEVWSEPELAWRLNAGRTRLVAVTGTNGKTTTTEMLATCLDAPAAGNIGTPLVQLLGGPAPPPLAVAELSSFQLRFASTLRPDVAVLLNLAPDHLDWHGSAQSYGEAKARLWAAQTASDAVVFNADDDGAARLVGEHPPTGRTASFTLSAPREGQVGVDRGWLVARLDGDAVRVVETSALTAKGPHNLANAAAATAAGLLAGGAPRKIASRLAGYRPGAHRLEHVATIDGVHYVNDSKATNPHAAAAALDAFAPPAGREPSVIWIAGGLGKGLSFDNLAGNVKESVRMAVTIGTSGPEIAAFVRASGRPVVEAGTLAAAVAAARNAARPGDTVLLAPACASMDQFRNYAERGIAFREAVAATPEGT